MKLARWIDLALALAVGNAEAPKVEQWEHGWKTARGIARRNTTPLIGYNVGFKFPLNPYDCDRAELTDFMELHGGWVWTAGGEIGAEMFVRFKGVNGRDAADKKILEILPALSKLIKDLGDGVKVTIPKRKEEASK